MDVRFVELMQSRDDERRGQLSGFFEVDVLSFPGYL
jgi:hypothetical protein